jgi:hypothetical protein
MAADGTTPTPAETSQEWHPKDSFEPSLCDAIAYFAKIEAAERDRALRADLIAAGINVPARDEDEDD